MKILDVIQAEIDQAERDGNFQGALYRLKAKFTPDPARSALCPAPDCTSCPVHPVDCPGLPGPVL